MDDELKLLAEREFDISTFKGKFGYVDISFDTAIKYNKVDILQVISAICREKTGFGLNGIAVRLNHMNYRFLGLNPVGYHWSLNPIRGIEPQTESEYHLLGGGLYMYPENKRYPYNRLCCVYEIDLQELDHYLVLIDNDEHDGELFIPNETLENTVVPMKLVGCGDKDIDEFSIIREIQYCVDERKM